MTDVRQLAVSYRLGLLDTNALVQIADTLLEEGCSAPTLIDLSILEAPIMAEAAPLFERACAELGVVVPTKDESISERLRFHLELIASGESPPRNGLQRIMDELYWPHISSEPTKKYVGDSRGLEHLIGAYWGYDDLTERPNEVSFDGKYGATAITAWEDHVRQCAQDWLQTHLT